VIAAALVCILTALSPPAAAAAAAVQLDVEGPIGPASTDYVVRGLTKAAEQGAALVILRIDTPGGLETSMREMIRAILASPVPIAAYVAPGGARAASAGTYILYAAHIAAMAPGTNLGAATPVELGGPGAPPSEPQRPRVPSPPGSEGDQEAAPGAPARPAMTDKAVNDAVAFIRSLAQLRGRNVEWAEKAVREAATLSAEEALKAGVIDVIATDIADLEAKIDGREVVVGGRTQRLATAKIENVRIVPDWRTKFLAVITNPNVAYILMLIGIYGLLFEFYSPGMVAPGVIGGICLLLALYALHVLPIDYTGLALTLLGLALMLSELFLPSFGVLGLGGLVAFVIGSIMLIDTDVPGFTVAWQLIGAVAVVAGLVFMTIGTVVVRARRRAVVAGPEQMVGLVGPVLQWSGNEGLVRVRGEIWRARASAPLTRGQFVKVTGLDGLSVTVTPETQEKG
jgi:membrane-bound serine protease (ClpP class)